MLLVLLFYMLHHFFVHCVRHTTRVYTPPSLFVTHGGGREGERGKEGVRLEWRGRRSEGRGGERNGGLGDADLER